MHRNVDIEFGIRWTGQHLDMMAQVVKGPAQLIEVDALTTAVGVAAVGEETDAKGSLHGHPSLHVPVDDGLRHADEAAEAWGRSQKSNRAK